MERTVITMFDYKEFKKEMSKRGHRVHKHGDYITIEPIIIIKDIIKDFYMHQMSLKDLSMN